MATDWTRWRRISAAPSDDAQGPPLNQDYGQFKSGWSEFAIPAGQPGAGATECGYLSDENRVWLKGQVSGGTMGQPIFRLPPHCSPPSPRLVSTVAQQSNSGLIAVALEIVPDNSVLTSPGALVYARGAAGAANRLALDGSFVMV